MNAPGQARAGVGQQRGADCPGVSLEVTFRDGRIEIEPAPREVQIVRKGRVKVAVPVEESAPLTARTILETQRGLRNRHR